MRVSLCCRDLSQRPFAFDGAGSLLFMKRQKDWTQIGGTESQLLGLNILSDLVFSFSDLRWNLHSDCMWLGKTSPLPLINIPYSGETIVGVMRRAAAFLKTKRCKELDNRVVNWRKRSMLVMCSWDILPSTSVNPVFVPVVETSHLMKPWFGAQVPAAIVKDLILFRAFVLGFRLRNMIVVVTMYTNWCLSRNKTD